MKTQKSSCAKTSAGQAKFKTCPVKLFTMFNLPYLTWNPYFAGIYPVKFNFYFTRIMFLTIILFGFFGVVGKSQAATRVFYEDCEDTSFSEYFLERCWGTSYQEWWDLQQTVITRSDIAHAGNYSMTYDPWTTTPKGVIANGDMNFGNTSNFSLSSINGRYWYFRWYQRWEAGATYGGENKLLYINYNGIGDFVLTLKKGGGANFHISVFRGDGYIGIDNPWPSHSGGSLDDEEWHKMEVLIDMGTTGDSNGEYRIFIDDILLHATTGLTLNGSISSNPITYVGWPSNSSSESGSQQAWLDDLEIYTLDDLDDIPDELLIEPDTTPPAYPTGLSVS